MAINNMYQDSVQRNARQQTNAEYQAQRKKIVEELLNQRPIAGKPSRPRLRFEVNAGDKDYDFAKTRHQVRRRGSRPLIAHGKRPDGSYSPEAEGF